MKLLDVQSTADFLGVSRATVTRMIEAGALPAVPIRSGRRKTIFRVPESALRKLLNLRANETLEPAIVTKTKKEKTLHQSEAQEDGPAINP